MTPAVARVTQKSDCFANATIVVKEGTMYFCPLDEEESDSETTVRTCRCAIEALETYELEVDPAESLQIGTAPFES